MSVKVVWMTRSGRGVAALAALYSGPAPATGPKSCGGLGYVAPSAALVNTRPTTPSSATTQWRLSGRSGRRWFREIFNGLLPKQTREQPKNPTFQPRRLTPATGGG